MKRALELAAGPLLLGFAAASLGSPALLAIAIGLAIVYAGAAQVVATAQRRVDVHGELLDPEVLEGQPARVCLFPTGLGGLPVGLEYRGDDDRWYRVEPGGVVRLRVSEPGRFQIDAGALRLRDDLGLLTRPVHTASIGELLVLPAPLAAASPPRSVQRATAGEPEPDGLTDYEPGTPVSRIHWKSLAGGGCLQQRRFRHSVEQLPLLVVDTSGSPTRAQLAWAARATAGAILRGAAGGGCRVLLPEERMPFVIADPAAGWAAVHRRLAELPSAPPEPGPGVDLADAEWIVAAQASPEQAVPLPQLPAPLRRAA